MTYALLVTVAACAALAALWRNAVASAATAAAASTKELAAVTAAYAAERAKTDALQSQLVTAGDALARSAAGASELERTIAVLRLALQRRETAVEGENRVGS